jgi:hypothetical protein
MSRIDIEARIAKLGGRTITYNFDQPTDPDTKDEVEAVLTQAIEDTRHWAIANGFRYFNSHEYSEDRMALFIRITLPVDMPDEEVQALVDEVNEAIPAPPGFTIDD